MGEYTEEHARAGLRDPLPALATWTNQFPGYEITLTFPEFTSVCPRTGLGDFGTITLRYIPRDRCVETKSLKLYLQAYRDLGIFQENAVNRILEDVVAAAEPEQAIVVGEFNPRGGVTSRIEVQYPRPDPSPPSSGIDPPRGRSPIIRRSGPNSPGT